MVNAYPFQARVADHLLHGRNVILQAPTGAGKTQAALLPFLDGLEQARPTFPQKCIYTVPMRTLANQFVSLYQADVFERAFRRKLQNQRDYSRPYVDIQTGEQRNDPFFEAALTFTTIDQALSSFLIAPYSLSGRLANLNAGAIAASYLVLDEFHLLDPESTLPTTLEMLQMVRGISPFLLMTATFSTKMLSTLADWLGAVVVGGSDAERAEFAALPSQHKTRRYHTVEQPLNAEQVIRAHAGKKRSLVVCNNVERSQTLFAAIRRDVSNDIETRLLHSRFLPTDRAAHETFIRETFGKTNDGSGSVIVVATQAIEVGLDMNCDVLHTELAPANAVIQRAGRCARYEGTEGDVYVYRYTEDRDGVPIDLIEKILPYAEQREVISLTWEALSARQGALDYAGEHEILNQAHGTADAQLCEELRSKTIDHRTDMFAVMAGREQGVSRLVRNIRQQKIIIHADPDSLTSSNADNNPAISPFALDGFNLQPGTVKGYAKEWLEERVLEDEPPFRVKFLDAEKDEEQQNHIIYRWLRAADAKALSSASIIAVHPDLAGYDPLLGFLPRYSNGRQPTITPNLNKPDPDQDWSPAYHLETYERHIQLVYEQFRDAWSELAYAARQLERRAKWPEGILHRAARLAIVLHDTGKLNREWQRWVQDWQIYIGHTDALRQDDTYAHTDNYMAEHWQKAKTFKRKRPAHAVEGAVVACYLLSAQFSEFRPVFEAVFSAITRHHSPHSTEFQPFHLEPNVVPRTAALLRRYLPELTFDSVSFPDAAKQQKIVVGDLLSEPGTKPDQENGYIAYLLLVRLLRRADQRGTKAGTWKE